MSHLEDRIPQLSSLSFGSYILSTPSCVMFLSLGGEGVINIPLGVRTQQSLILSTFISYESLHWLLPTAETASPSKTVKAALIYGCKHIFRNQFDSCLSVTFVTTRVKSLGKYFILKQH